MAGKSSMLTALKNSAPSQMKPPLLSIRFEERAKFADKLGNLVQRNIPEFAHVSHDSSARVHDVGDVSAM